VLFLVPWTIRNYDVSDGSFIPLSVQDGAIAGTFNDTSANDDENPYKWRVITERDRDIVTPPPGAPRLTEAELLKEFRKRGLRYIRDHPASVPKAFFWNGITRFWDLRSPAKIKDDALVQRGVGWVAIAGVVLHWLLLPLALVGLWRLRHNRQWFVTVVLLAALMSVATTVVSGTRYRTPLEPVVAVLACSLLAPRQNRLAS
jgi:hypothetical protein